MSMMKILIPLDGSELAEKALPIAMSLAARSGAEICLVSVVDSKAGDLSSADSDLYLEDVSASLRQSGLTSCFRTKSGPAAQCIVETAVDYGADLIVMTTRGRSGIARGILGSVTDAVISHASVPVYVVRPDNARRAGAESEYDSGVIVPLDGSELAETAIDDAVRIAELSLSPVFLLRVIGKHADTEERDTAGAYLEQISSRLARLKVLAIPELVTGHPVESILRTMERRPGSVVVLTTRGAGGLTRWVRGSVADRLIQQAPGPIIVVSPRQHVLLGSVIH
jgi:nucleotide-binding universal stress UspA family protein